MTTYLNFITVGDGRMNFEYVQVCYEREGVIYFGIHRSEIDFDNLPDVEKLENPTRIPLEIFPVYEKSLFGEAFTTPPVGCHVRRPCLLAFDLDDPKIPTICDMVLREAQVYKAIMEAPNRHLASYLGCFVRENRVIGFCLKKYSATVFDRIEQGALVDTEAVVRDVREAVEHLHSLGYCHNDIHVNNIMFDDDGSALLIDFEFAAPVGESLPQVRKTSSRENDHKCVDELATGIAKLVAIFEKKRARNALKADSSTKDLESTK